MCVYSHYLHSRVLVCQNEQFGIGGEENTTRSHTVDTWTGLNWTEQLQYAWHLIIVWRLTKGKGALKINMNRHLDENISVFTQVGKDRKAYVRKLEHTVCATAGDEREEQAYWSYYSSSGGLLRKKGLWSARENQVAIKLPLRQWGMTTDVHDEDGCIPARPSHTEMKLTVVAHYFKSVTSFKTAVIDIL